LTLRRINAVISPPPVSESASNQRTRLTTADPIGH
jgi:hypothetical protein